MRRPHRPSIALLASLLASAPGCGLLLDAQLGGAQDDATTPAGSDGGAGRPDGAPRVDADVPLFDGSGRDADRPSDADRPFDAGGGADGSTPRVDGDVGADAGGLLGVGDGCSEDGRCASGYCYDVSLSNPFCFGSICTIPCRDASACMAYAAAHGGYAADRSCVRHSAGFDFVCDFSWGALPGAAIACE